MNIVLAASIYPPEVGGPSFYAASLKSSLEKLGHQVDVAVLSKYKHWPSGVRHLLYAFHLLRMTGNADAIIAFDIHASGLPALVCGRIRRVPLAIRVGGDFVWEHYCNRTGDLVPLPFFYDHPKKWNVKERVVFRIIRFVIRRALLVCTTPWVVQIWQQPYALDMSRVRVIENAIEPKLESIAPARKNFIFYSRQIPLKNNVAFRAAFAKAKETYPEIELDEGMVSHKELMQKMQSCYAAVVPSISEVTPNYVTDSIRCGKPFLLTKYSGYAEPFGEYGVLVDPLSIDDMARGIEEIANPANYEKLRAKIAQFNAVRTYDDIAREFVALLHKNI